MNRKNRRIRYNIFDPFVNLAVRWCSLSGAAYVNQAVGFTHQQRGQSGDQGVEQNRWDGAAVLGSQVWFGVGVVVAEEALHMHAESVRVLEVIGQHDGPGHDH